ncbi:MAG: NAD-dependent epimerase/dehydratase family protein [Rhizobiaceae bacterium]
MKILVSGGSGFLGASLIPQLVRDGHQIPALARSPASDARVRALGAEPVGGDVEQSLALPPLDAVVHAAAHFRFAGPRAAYFRTNVDGTRALLQAAAEAGAARFVYISAAAVIMDGAGSPIRNAGEGAPTFPSSFSAYIASKAQGESAVLAADRPGFRTIAQRPPDPPLSRTMVRLIGREFTTSAAAARRELGYAPRITRSEGLAGYRPSP